MTKQTIAAALLAYGAYMTYKCPCERIMSCHKLTYLLSVGGASLLVWHDNVR